MDWLGNGSCFAAEQFGWFVGTRSGIFTDVIATVMYVSSRAFLLSVRRMVSDRRRLALQSLMRTLPWLFPIIWTICAAYVGVKFFHCFAMWLVLGAAAVGALGVVLVMLAAANRVGGKGVRS
jgi:hypothetical protein